MIYLYSFFVIEQSILVQMKRVFTESIGNKKEFNWKLNGKLFPICFVI